MVRPYRDDRGALRARKRIPDAVRDEYARLYGVRHEAKFYASPDVPAHEQRRLFSEWLSEVEGRIAAITAARKGEGVALTPREARALAGEWYDWFVGRHPADHSSMWEDLRDAVHDQFTAAVHHAGLEEDLGRLGDRELWKRHSELREAVRPTLEDVGETAQFLATKRVALNGSARGMFLDYLYEDLAAALRQLSRVARGDHTPDKYPVRFPKRAGAETGILPWELFTRWVAERKPAQTSIESWRFVFRAMAQHFEGRSAGSILPEEADAWIQGLISKERSEHTVRRTWLTASKAVFTWGVKKKHLPSNPFVDVYVTVPRKQRLRDTRALLTDEWRTILTAAAQIKDPRTPDELARRWVPWLQAYTGARPGEVTQLRDADVITRDGIPALRLTPEAGTVKSGYARVVPLHEHLIAQGFLEFVSAQGRGPLFYRAANAIQSGDDPVRQRKPRYAQARQRLAKWVRDLGITDPELQPNHGWRHTFKRIGRSEGISDAILDVICGQAPANVAAGYGQATLEDMAKALQKFPRYRLSASKGEPAA